MTLATKERFPVVVDPVECGQPALVRALRQLDPSRHEPTPAVMTVDVPLGVEDAMAGIDPAFGYAGVTANALVGTPTEMGFEAGGRVAPARREQLETEIAAIGPSTRHGRCHPPDGGDACGESMPDTFSRRWDMPPSSPVRTRRE